MLGRQGLGRKTPFPVVASFLGYYDCDATVVADVSYDQDQSKAGSQFLRVYIRWPAEREQT